MNGFGLALTSIATAATIACVPGDGSMVDAGTPENDAAACAPEMVGMQTADSTLPVDAQKAILGAFDEYRVVGGMNAGHGNKEVSELIFALIRNPGLPDKVNDIVVECGNSIYQDVLDRYIAGEDVPLSEARLVWRNTSEPKCGFSAFYEQLFPLVRRVNQKLPPEKKLRVLAGDSPIDWSRVQSMDDFESMLGAAEAIAATMMEEEVLKKGRRALMLFGINHMRHDADSIVGIYEQHGYKNMTFVIADHHGFGNHTPLARDNDTLEARMASWPVPSLVSFEGTWLASLDSAYFGNEPPGQCGNPGVDGYLYVGPRAFLMHESISTQAFLDQEYVAELRQRASRLGSPPNSPQHPERMIQMESESSAFNYDFP